MQKQTLSIKVKSKILSLLIITTLVISIPLGFDRVDSSERGYYAIHVISIIFGLFLSVVGIITYIDFRNTRLLMVFSAFFSITIAESTFIINLIYPIYNITYGIHDLIIHSLILLMLSFFTIGIFRPD